MNQKIYVVVNDKGGNVADRVEYAFMSHESAIAYAKQLNEEWEGMHHFWVESIWFHS